MPQKTKNVALCQHQISLRFLNSLWKKDTVIIQLTYLRDILSYLVPIWNWNKTQYSQHSSQSLWNPPTFLKSNCFHSNPIYSWLHIAGSVTPIQIFLMTTNFECGLIWHLKILIFQIDFTFPLWLLVSHMAPVKLKPSLPLGLNRAKAYILPRAALAPKKARGSDNWWRYWWFTPWEFVSQVKSKVSPHTGGKKR